MTDGEVFTSEMEQGGGLMVSTGILDDLELPAGIFDPDYADEIRELRSCL